MTATTISPTEFQLSGVPPEQDAMMRQIATEAPATLSALNTVDGVGEAGQLVHRPQPRVEGFFVSPLMPGARSSFSSRRPT